MAWSGAPGTGHLIMGSGMVIAVDQASIGVVMVSSVVMASGFVVQTTSNVAGSGAAITGNPALYEQVSFRGVDYLRPLYRKV